MSGISSQNKKEGGRRSGMQIYIYMYISNPILMEQLLEKKRGRLNDNLVDKN